MSNFDRTKQVTRGPFKTREDARRDARAFRRIGGAVARGGVEDGAWWWHGSIKVEDMNESVSGSFGCGRCAKTGRFITGMLNGKPTGPGGICFRCNGKGFHTHEDRKRNLFHDTHAFCQAARDLARA